MNRAARRAHRFGHNMPKPLRSRCRRISNAQKRADRAERSRKARASAKRLAVVA